MTIQSIIEDIRLETADEAKGRWTDKQCLAFIKKAVRRLNHFGRKNNLQFVKRSQEYTLTPSVSVFDLPDDFLTDIGLWRTDTHERLTKKTESEWESIVSTSAATVYIIKDGQFEVMAADNIPLKLHYFSFVDASALTESSPSPWGGKLDDLLVEYGALRMKNVDEMDAGFDLQLMKELEISVLESYATQAPTVIRSRGWLG